MNRISIIVVDDHKLFREFWKVLLINNKNYELVGESGEFNQAIELIRAKRPQIVLLDINLSQDSGFDAVPLIRKYSPGTKVIAVSMHTQPAYAKRMLQLGAKGYVTKNSSAEEVIKAIDEVAAGKNYVCMEIKEIITGQIMSDEAPVADIKNLSIREIEIIKKIRDGYSSKEIADQLKISVRTVEVHRHNILKKLQLKNTAALVSFIHHSNLGF